jgi:predicted Zn-dependent peptidase
MMGKSILDLNRIDTLTEIFDSIRKVTAAELQDLANEMFAEDQLSTLTFLPEQ